MIKSNDEALTSEVLTLPNTNKNTSRNKNNISRTEDKAGYDMVVFCHLRWDFVFQRPQHLVTRLSQYYKILFVEEPVPYSEDEKYSAVVKQVSASVTVIQPRVDTVNEISEVLKKYITPGIVPVGWFYSAAFIPVLEKINFCSVIYDCMDELSLFKNAPQQLIMQEAELISRADIVFTGGKSLYESKRRYKTNTYCFPSSVDRDHFDISGKKILVPEDLSCLPGPVIGYYGVIDERIDYTLLEQTAGANPDCSFVMIGPLAKITPGELPAAKNLHFPGMRSYGQLPAYLQGFDIAMMPFAMNDATKYISPTKTLEYMAGGKPVISTPVHDVVRDYNHCVKIISDGAGFTKAIKEILTDKSKSYLQAYTSILEATSWDATSLQMIELIKTVERV